MTALERLERAAGAVYDVATRKGALFATDPETGSDTLVGFFVPAGAMNDLGRALAALMREKPRAAV